MAADHPRIRGEHHSPPQTPLADDGIIPAYAGSTRPPATMLTKSPDHPRIRGEHGHGLFELADGAGSSPHTRGAQNVVSGRRVLCRIIPAYAGSTSCCRVIGAPGADHPRIRGEHTRKTLTRADPAGSSPHTRGARRYPAADRGPGRIIPAYAGSTRPAPPGSSPKQDHPRIRGEHKPLLFAELRDRGSSPHTRGARYNAHKVALEAGDHPRIRGEHTWKSLQYQGSPP